MDSSSELGSKPTCASEITTFKALSNAISLDTTLIGL